MRAIRSFFVSLKHIRSISTLIQVFIRIPLNKLLWVITNSISRYAKLEGKIPLMEVYGLLGDILLLLKHNKIIEFEEILFQAFLSEKVLPTLIEVQSSKGGTQANNHCLERIITCIIEIILQSKSMVLSTTLVQCKVRPVIESIVKSTVAGGKIFDRDIVETGRLRQWTGTLICHWKLCRPRISLRVSSTNLNEKQRESSQRKQRPIFKNDVVNMMFEFPLIIPLTWGLVHLNKSILSNCAIIFDSMNNEIDILLDNTRLVYLLKRGYIQILYGVREKCRILERIEAVKSVDKFLNGIRSKLLSVTVNQKENVEGIDSFIDLFHLFCEELKVSMCKPLVFRELFLLCVDILRNSGGKLSWVKAFEKLPFMIFSWKKNKNIFLCIKQVVEILRYVSRHSNSISSAYDLYPMDFTKSELSRTIVHAEVYCQDKDVTVMMECTSMQKLISNAPLLAKKVSDIDSLFMKMLF